MIDKVEGDKCPFCGREAQPFSSNSEDHCHYVGDLAERLKMVRSPSCYEAEIDSLKSLVWKREKLLGRVTWRTKIHLSGCQCADCKAVEKVLNRQEDRAIMDDVGFTGYSFYDNRE
jgi:hypothetical protein